MNQKKSFFKRFWLIWIILAIGMLILIVLMLQKHSGTGKEAAFNSKYPVCPQNIAGIFTKQLMNPEDILALIPLGNVAPPGHVYPVDHIYFQAPTDKVGTKIPMYAPADMWLTGLTSETESNGNAKYDLTFAVCRGISIELAGQTSLSSDISSELSKVKANKCDHVEKPNHPTTDNCEYTLDYKISAGAEIGSATGDPTQTIEVWAYNYNTAPRSDVDWFLYHYGDYAYSFCLFDLYSGTIKDQYYSKFGFIDLPKYKDKSGILYSSDFKPRTAEPKCGLINQDIVGSAQGAWFGQSTKEDKSHMVDQKGLSLIHNNIDPTMGEIVGGDDFSPNNLITFTPTHTELINRDFSEVHADGNIYCYSGYSGYDSQVTESGKTLIELTDDHHLKIEQQDGACGANEEFNNPLAFER